MLSGAFLCLLGVLPRCFQKRAYYREASYSHGLSLVPWGPIAVFAGFNACDQTECDCGLRRTQLPVIKLPSSKGRSTAKASILALVRS